MNNQTKPRRTLPTNRSFLIMFIRRLLSFCILLIIDLIAMQIDLNTILKPYTSKRTNFCFFGHRSEKLMNEELKRRGIDYQVRGFLPYNKSITALNLLCEDYNKNG